MSFHCAKICATLPSCSLKQVVVLGYQPYRAPKNLLRFGGGIIRCVPFFFSVAILAQVLALSQVDYLDVSKFPLGSFE